jgi:branched-chain amino acid transport system substrate-binding protein
MASKRTKWKLLLGFAMLAVFDPQASRAQTVVKIGIINSFSGFLAAPGDEMQKGMDLYAKEHTKDLPEGVRIEIVKRDDGTSPEVGKRVAQELITRDKVNILLGVMGSPIAAAIPPFRSASGPPSRAGKRPSPRSATSSQDMTPKTPSTKAIPTPAARC